MEIKSIIEATLFVADKPLTIAQLQNIFPEIERPARKEVNDALNAITEAYRERPIQLSEVASGFRFQVRQALSPWVSRLFEERPPRYSRALLETLAIVIYKQPVTRGEIEQVRGVAVSSNIIHTLLEREWLRVIGHKETPGRPALYATTRQLLDYFNLKSLDELPPISSFESFADQQLALNGADDLADPYDAEAEQTMDRTTTEMIRDEQAEQ